MGTKTTEIRADDRGLNRIELPEKVSQVICVLEAHGFEAYAVGGCVRDRLMGREPEDWDITTDASPQQVKQVFHRTIDTGIVHGTVTVLLGKDGFEVTTYRVDGDYEDSRHPSSVTFTKNLKEDLKRRDFTINAMAYNERDGLVDCFGGRQDLEDKVIRCVGIAEERFHEDALRILRCLRFSAQLGFQIEEKTALAAVSLADTLQKISAERIAAEWTKLLMSPHADRVQTAWEYGVLKQFFPEVRVDEQLISGIKVVSSDADDAGTADVCVNFAGARASSAAEQKYLRYAMLFCNLSSDTVSHMLRRLKFDNQTIYTVRDLVKYLRADVKPESAAVRRSIYEMGEDLYPLLLIAWKAYRKAGHTDGMDLTQTEQIEKLYEDIICRGDCLSLKTLAVGGKDLIAVGIEPGEKLGQTLQALLDIVLESPGKNRADVLLPLAKEKFFQN